MEPLTYIYLINIHEIITGRGGGARSNAADSRSVDLGLREFESLPLHQKNGD